MVAKLHGPALFDIAHHAVLFRSESVILAICPAGYLKNIRHFESRTNGKSPRHISGKEPHFPVQNKKPPPR
jgi:hypothetical protein